MAIDLSDGFDYVGTEVPVRFKIGQFVEFILQVTDNDGNILDITNRSYQAKIGPGGGANAIATFSYQVTNGPQGLVKFSLDSTGMTAGQYRLEVWENNTNFLMSGPVEVVSKEVI